MSLDMPAVSPATPPPGDSTDLLDSLTAVFRRVLELAEVPADADFFLLGGDSLIATRVLSAVARTHGVELTFEDFLAAPTPAGLAARIAAAGGTAAPAATVPAAR
ncbi:acyl carrier protein [Streptomyces sp. TLI_171]|uniref:acyl carrier protein n=1 Tax=Streptomyces sp. TLI_171 TaxID=1938859 RepID=UPI000C1A6136|nr:acyl carrier protein [Streptomyces sp. TLI_171]RKE22243.1 phosphopantetheine binding protein [Streptomyces sp. TLI_171]